MKQLRAQSASLDLPRLNRWTLPLLLSVLVLAALAVRAQDGTRHDPPPTRRDNVADDHHGVKVVDPYRWLEDQTSPETRAWIDAQDWSDRLVNLSRAKSRGREW